MALITRLRHLSEKIEFTSKAGRVTLSIAALAAFTLLHSLSAVADRYQEVPIVSPAEGIVTHLADGNFVLGRDYLTETTTFYWKPGMPAAQTLGAPVGAGSFQGTEIRYAAGAAAPEVVGRTRLLGPAHWSNGVFTMLPLQYEPRDFVAGANIFVGFYEGILVDGVLVDSQTYLQQLFPDLDIIGAELLEINERGDLLGEIDINDPNGYMYETFIALNQGRNGYDLHLIRQSLGTSSIEVASLNNLRCVALTNYNANQFGVYCPERDPNNYIPVPNFGIVSGSTGLILNDQNELLLYGSESTLLWNELDGTRRFAEDILGVPGDQFPSLCGLNNEGTVMKRKITGDYVLYIPNPLVLGDTDCDGTVSFDDITPFVGALSGPETYFEYSPRCTMKTADMNQDGRVDFSDIHPFINAIGRR